MALFDAFKDRADRIEVLKPRHEQSAAHIADAYFRACGRPLATMTSIGPGSINTAIGLATAYVDSIPLVALTGGPQSYMYGRAVLQELERPVGQLRAMFEPIIKRSSWPAPTNGSVHHTRLQPHAQRTARPGARRAADGRAGGRHGDRGTRHRAAPAAGRVTPDSHHIDRAASYCSPPSGR